MNPQPPPDPKPSDEWLPAPHRNLTPYALGAIGVLVVAARFRVVPTIISLLLIGGVVAVMSSTRKREHRERYEAQLRYWHAQNPKAGQHSDTPPFAPPARSGWSIAGTALAAIAAVGGLAILGMTVLLFVALSSGNFKLGNK